jgi:small-conductance mechanosensitive channel
MSLSVAGIVLGLVNVGIVVVFLLLIGVAVWWVFYTWITPLPLEMRKLYIALVALVALYMVLAIFFGLPTWHVITGLDTAAPWLSA